MISETSFTSSQKTARVFDDIAWGRAEGVEKGMGEFDSYGSWEETGPTARAS